MMLLIVLGLLLIAVAFAKFGTSGEVSQQVSMFGAEGSLPEIWLPYGLLAVAVLLVVLWGLDRLFSVPSAMRRLSLQQDIKQSREVHNQGILDLAVGESMKTEQSLLSSLEHAERRAKTNSRSASLARSIGKLSLRNDRAEQAVKSRIKAARLEPIAESLTELGLALEADGREADAVSVYRDAGLLAKDRKLVERIANNLLLLSRSGKPASDLMKDSSSVEGSGVSASRSVDVRRESKGAEAIAALSYHVATKSAKKTYPAKTLINHVASQYGVVPGVDVDRTPVYPGTAPKRGEWHV